MPRVVCLVMTHVHNEAGTAGRFLDAIVSICADQAVGRGSHVARHLDHHDGRQNIIRMVDVERLLSGSLEHILWGVKQDHVINVYHIGSADHKAA